MGPEGMSRKTSMASEAVLLKVLAPSTRTVIDFTAAAELAPATLRRGDGLESPARKSSWAVQPRSAGNRRQPLRGRAKPGPNGRRQQRWSYWKLWYYPMRAKELTSDENTIEG